MTVPEVTQYGGWALITGASSGLGREFARALAKAGVPCILLARRKDRIEALAEELHKNHGVECRCIVQDLSVEDFLAPIRQAARDIPIGILVNNAGFGYGGRFQTRDPDRLAMMIRVNCLAPVLLTHAFLPPMLQRGCGAIVIVSSVLGLVPGPFDSTYAATKAFDLSFGESLWAEMQGTGIHVLTVCPGVTATEFFEVEGFSDETRRRILRKADRPDQIVALALKALGRKPTVLAPHSHRAATLLRLFPRKTVAGILRQLMTQRMGYDKLG